MDPMGWAIAAAVGLTLLALVAFAALAIGGLEESAEPGFLDPESTPEAPRSGPGTSKARLSSSRQPSRAG